MPNSEASRQIALIADDYKDTAETLAELLEGYGFHAAVAFDGDEAVSLAIALHPSLIILDICLPRRSGFEVCARIRQEPWARQVRILAVTGQNLATMQQEISDAGFDAVLGKPYSCREIAALFEQPQGCSGPAPVHSSAKKGTERRQTQ